MGRTGGRRASRGHTLPVAPGPDAHKGKTSPVRLMRGTPAASARWRECLDRCGERVKRLRRTRSALSAFAFSKVPDEVCQVGGVGVDARPSQALGGRFAEVGHPPTLPRAPFRCLDPWPIASEGCLSPPQWRCRDRQAATNPTTTDEAPARTAAGEPASAGGRRGLEALRRRGDREANVPVAQIHRIGLGCDLALQKGGDRVAATEASRHSRPYQSS